MRLGIYGIDMWYVYINCVCVHVFIRKLTKVLKNYVDHAEKLTDQLLKAMKALEYIFKFIVRSRVLFNQYVCSVMFGFSKPNYKMDRFNSKI